MQYVLSDDWGNIKDIVIYGYGRLAQDFLKFFIRNFHVNYIVDSDASKCDQMHGEIPVKHIDEVENDIAQYKVIIIAVERNAVSISKRLDQLGMKKNEDYCIINVFISEWFWRFQRKCMLMEVHETITTRCTLKCAYCNMFMPHYKEQYDYTKEDIKRDLDLLFAHVDYIFVYKILGGEPLLNQQISSILAFIAEEYGDKIGTIGVITNGTLLPDERLIEISKQYNIHYFISDYTKQVSYAKRLKELKRLLDDYKVPYRIDNNLRWCDFGFPHKNFRVENHDFRHHMLTCSPLYHGLNDGKFYYCHVAWSANKCNLLKEVTDDFIDLEKLDKGSETAKEMIIEHSSGNMGKGFVKLCSVCGGCGEDNHQLIPVAEQLK